MPYSPGNATSVGECRLGGVRDLYVPAALGYGDQATGSIPAGSPLVFEIKLLAVSA